VYPPQDDCSANNSTLGDGECGVNGNEKIFQADQAASDCDGNLAGPFDFGGVVLDTTTTVLGDDTAIYKVTLPPDFGGGFQQNQLTTLPGNGVRVRTAQTFDLNQLPEAVSFFREFKQANVSEWLDKLADVRLSLNILPSDHCGWDAVNEPSNISCTDHFGFEVP